MPPIRAGKSVSNYFRFRSRRDVIDIVVIARDVIDVVVIARDVIRRHCA